MRRLWFVLPVAASVLAACTSTPAQTARAAQVQQAVQDKLAQRLAGFTPGERSSCLPLAAQVSSARLEGYGRTLLYSVNNSLIYRTDTTGGCEGVGNSDDILVTVSNQGRSCQGDIARTVDRGSRITTGSCGLGEFVTYRRAR